MRAYLSLFFIIFSAILIFGDADVKFLHLGKEYNLNPLNRKSIGLNRVYNPLSDIDVSQTHRILVNSIDKSRIYGLKYAGDTISFNGITISRTGLSEYRILDEASRIEVLFGIGEFDALVLYSYLDFGQSSETVNKIATVFTVKFLLKKMNGDMEEKLPIPEIITREDLDRNILKYYEKDKENYDFLIKSYQLDGSSGHYRLTRFGAGSESRKKIRDLLLKAGYQMDRSLSGADREKQLNEFINELGRLSRAEVFQYLQQFIEYNIRIIPDNTMESDWVSPYDLYYQRQGNYKSIAYFNYFILTRLGFDCRTYFASELKMRERDELLKIGRMKDSEKIELETGYRRVKTRYNRNVLLNYHPPVFSRSIFIATVFINNRWLYTTGSGWTDHQIYKPERVCSDFFRRGCYYTTVNQTEIFYYNLPVNEETLEWDVFYDVR
jgi:hypothetical protein